MGGALFATSKISDAYQVATRWLYTDERLQVELGTPERAMLVGTSFKLNPGRSCAELSFLVQGKGMPRWVTVYLRRVGMRSPWQVYDATTGWGRSETDCA